MKRGLLLFLILLIAVATAMLVHTPQAAAKERVTVYVHKLLFANGELPDAAINDGVSDPFADLLLDYQGVNDVGFTIYDVTAAFYELRSEGLTVEAAQQHLAEQTPADPIASVTTATVNGEKGIASASLPATDDLGRDSVYLFLETDLPPQIELAADPFVVVLPIFNDEGVQLSQIHLYPKNEEKVLELPPLVKEITDDGNDFGYGEEISYQITTTIPSHVLNDTAFQITDLGDDSLQILTDSITVALTDSQTADFYQVTAVSDHGFTIVFDPVKLHADVGKTLTIAYRAILKDETLQKSEFANQATLTIDPDLIVKAKAVAKTGGRRFLKVDLADQDKPLAGAYFLVMNSEYAYLKRAGLKNEWLTLDQPTLTAARASGLLLLQSDAAGMFQINGLAYGTYRLVEVAAPSGYQTNEETITFTVDSYSFEASQSAPFKIINKKEPPASEEPTRSGRFPKTADMLNAGLVLAGIGVLLLLGYIRKKKTEE